MSGDTSYNNDELSNINFPNTNDPEITVITPENITYTGPMEGYYPGTYSFDNDEDNNNPEDWEDWSETNCDAQIIAEKSGHKKVLELSDNSGTNIAQVFQTYSNAQITGVIEWWWSSDDVSKLSRFQIYASDDTQAIVIQMDSGKFQYYDSPTPTDISGVTPLNGIWHHMKLIFDCSSDTFDLYIDGVLRLNDGNFRNVVNDCEWLRFQTMDSDSGYYQYIDAIGYSWNSDYNLGDNLNEGLLLSYDNATALDWKGYSLDGVANNTILGNTTIPLPENGYHNIQVFGNDSLGTNYNSNIRHFTVKYITISTPENKTYTEPMSGYYPATYGFENDKDNNNPEDWVDWSDTNCDAQIIAEKSGHKKVLELSDNSGTNIAQVAQNYSNVQITGEIEWWWSTDDVSKLSRLQIYASDDTQAIVIQMDSDKFQYYDSPTPTDISGVTPLNGIWHHLKLIFNCSSDTFDLYIDWTLRLNDANFRNVVNDCKWIRFQTDGSDSGYYQYIDAIGYSWSSDYNTGDNLDEGLLLSFDNSTTLDWIGFSLDGQGNKTILGNTTIPLPEDGYHNIQVFGNNSIGIIHTSDIRYFSMDTLSPIITINSPLQNEYFSSTAPNFDVSIMEPNLNTTWYTLDSGLINITFTGFTGTIDQTEWGGQVDGLITIRFYANDTFGHINHVEILVEKDTLDPVITINSPLTGEIFTVLPPEFNLTIDEVNLDTTWYTLDEGATTIDFAGLIGYIDSTAWNNAPIGAVTIRFYARDKAGNEIYQEVIVIKSSSQQEPPEIPGFNIALLCLAVVIITTSLLKIKKYKVK